MTTQTLSLDAITLDDTIQQRERIHDDRVAEYAESLDALPPVTVFYDGTRHWLAGGYHRFQAHRLGGRKELQAEVRPGTRREAILFAVGDNATHGLHRSLEDKRKSVRTLLEDAEWGRMATDWIAQQARVSWALVDKLRQEHLSATETNAEGDSGAGPEWPRRVTKTGVERKAHNDRRRTAAGDRSGAGAGVVAGTDPTAGLRGARAPGGPTRPAGPAWAGDTRRQGGSDKSGARGSLLKSLSGRIGTLVREIDAELTDAGLSQRPEHAAFLTATSNLLVLLQRGGMSDV